VPLKTKITQSAASAPLRKTKFQADLAPADDRAIRFLKEELQLSSNTDFLSDALALFRWAVSERRLGHKIVSESANGERKVLLFPRLERVAPATALPHVKIKWTERELAALANLAFAAEANRPTEALIRAMKD
jgi:DNA-binding transcriptional regulator YbjK